MHSQHLTVYHHHTKDHKASFVLRHYLHMALDTIIYPQSQIGNFGYDYYTLQEDDTTFNGFLNTTTDNNIINHLQESAASDVHYAYWGDHSSSSSLMHVNDQLQWDLKSSPEGCPEAVEPPVVTAGVGRRKRRRNKSGKNKEEMEHQRMTHITVERNRRKQMNEYLAVIRSLMPSSYVQRGDQASIVGGAINFVKELEQQLQTLEVQKRASINDYSPPPPPQPFGDFFAFPQYSIRQASGGGCSATTAKNRPPAMAEIEVTLVESQANLKILSKKRHRQLLKLVDGLKCCWLTILHLNVTTVEDMVLYTLNVKLEDGCQLNSVDDIADTINCLLCRIEEESLCSN